MQKPKFELDKEEDFGIEFSMNYIDYDLYAPCELDAKRNTNDAPDSYFLNVPLIRIFGRTDAGQHVCAFVHGVYPYLYIDYEGSLDSATGASFLYTSSQLLSLTHHSTSQYTKVTSEHQHCACHDLQAQSSR